MFCISGLVAQNFPGVANTCKNCQIGSLNYWGGFGFLKSIWYSIKLYIEIFQVPIEVCKQTPVSGFLNILRILHLFSVGFCNIRPFVCWMQKKGLLCYANYRKILAFPHWAGDHQVIETGLHGQGKNHILYHG